MKSRIISTIAYVIAFIFAAFKTLTVFNSIDPETGFFLNHNKEKIFYFVTVIFLILLFALSVLLRRCPIKGPKVGLPLFIASILYVIALVFNIMLEIIPEKVNVNVAQRLVLITAVLFCLFIVAYFVQYLVDYKINKVFYIAPLVFWLSKMVFEYIKTAKMPFIMENAFKILTTAFVAIFFLYFAKYQCRLFSKNSHKAFLFFGASAAMLCESFSIPQLLFIFKNGFPVVNGSTIIRYSIPELSLFAATGIFILVYLHSFFSNRNLVRHSHHSNSKVILKVDDTPDNTNNNTEV